MMGNRFCCNKREKETPNLNMIRGKTVMRMTPEEFHSEALASASALSSHSARYKGEKTFILAVFHYLEEGRVEAKLLL